MRKNSRDDILEAKRRTCFKKEEQLCPMQLIYSLNAAMKSAIVPIILYLLKLALWLRMQLMFINVSPAAEGCSILYKSDKAC